MLTVCYLVIIILTISRSQDLGDKCTLQQSKGDGECVLFSQCQSAIREKQDGKRPQLCGFEGIQPIVCCPKNKEDTSRLVSSKSKQKCDQYIARAGMPLPPSIVNGIPAESGEHPHMVALGYGPKNSTKWLCGGSLISDNYVLTAAHCITSPDSGSVQWARMGTVNLKEPSKGGIPEDFEIVERHVHPEYKKPSAYNDIALLKLNYLVSLTEFVQPACIGSEFHINKSVEAVGWGKTGFTRDTTNNLLKVTLEIYDKEVCKKTYDNISKRVLANGILDEKQVCAGGGLNESKDTCQGDSGGPLHQLIVDNSYKLYNVIGVTSFGKACGIQNVPGVYTRVSYYVPWIESVVWP